jgi:hypothetical protein
VNRVLSRAKLAVDNVRFAGTGGVSRENRCCGFVPAFQDGETRDVCVSAFADGRPAPFHVLDGVPEAWVVARDGCGHVLRVKGCVVAGFLREGRFYTREEAAAAIREESPSEPAADEPDFDTPAFAAPAFAANSRS